MNRLIDALTAFPRTTIAVALGLTFGLFMFSFAADDYRDFRDVPRESAQVRSVAHGTGDITCGKRTKRPDLATWHVDRPRPGFPAEFVHAHCPGDVHVGDRNTVARLDAGRTPRLMFDPFDGWGEPALIGLGAGALFSVIMLIFQTRDGGDFVAAWLTRGRARREQERRREQGRRREEERRRAATGPPQTFNELIDPTRRE